MDEFATTLSAVVGRLSLAETTREGGPRLMKDWFAQPCKIDAPIFMRRS